MNQPTPEQIARLPKWAQEHIRDLEGHKDIAQRKLREYLETQEQTNCWTDELVCMKNSGPEWVRRYFKVANIEVAHKGVHLTVSGLRSEDNDIRLSWRPVGNGGNGSVAFTPWAYQQARLVNVVYDEHELKRLQALKGSHERQET